jgi:hypothetical protein
MPAMSARAKSRPHRWFVLFVAAMAATTIGLAPPIAAAPPAAAPETPIGNLGDTLRVNYKGIVADVSVRDVVPTDAPPGYTPNGSPRWRDQGGPWRATVTVHAIQVPNPFVMSIAFAFNGVTPFADAYGPKNTDAPDALQTALLNAPAGSTVTGAVYWQVYRDLVSTVVLLNPQTGTHLAQWNIWQPDTPIP